MSRSLTLISQDIAITQIMHVVGWVRWVRRQIGYDANIVWTWPPVH